MKKIGLIGGLGPESTLQYYRGIIEAFKPTYDETGNPEIVIESVNLKQVLNWAEHNQWDKVAAQLGERCECMRQAGAEFGAISANTPHKVFDDIQAGTSLPLLSIVVAARRKAQEIGLQKLLLLGTGFTMRSDFYARDFRLHGIDIIVPTAEHQRFIHDKIFSEIELGIIKASTQNAFINIVNSHLKDKIDGVILGCTELPLILKQQDIDIACLDTTQIHIDAMVKFSLQD